MSPEGFTPPPVHHVHSRHVELPHQPIHYVHPDVIRAEEADREQRRRDSLKRPKLGLCIAISYGGVAGYLSFKVIAGGEWWFIFPPLIFFPLAATTMALFIVGPLEIVAYFILKWISPPTAKWLNESSLPFTLWGTFLGGLIGALSGALSHLF